MSTPWLDIRGLAKSFDGISALVDFSCTVDNGEIVGLIGPNGSGKTTLFNVITGFLQPDTGSVIFKGQPVTRKSPHHIANAGIARTFQSVRLIRRATVVDNVLLFFKEQPGELLANVFIRPVLCNRRERAACREALTLLESAGLAHKAYDMAENLSYGQQKLLSIVCCMASGAALLLLDEPIAGIAPPMIESIVNIIRLLPSQRRSVILIEHNMDVITDICDRVIFMDSGAKICEGSSREVQSDPRVIEAYID